MNDTKLNPNLALRGVWARIFIKQGRLRPTLRIIVYGLIYFLTMLVVNSLLHWFVFNPLSLPNWLLEVLKIARNIGCVLLATYLVRRFLDKRTLSSLGLSRYQGWLADIAMGIGLGGLLNLLGFLAQWGSGWLTISGFAWQSLPAGDLLSGLALGCLLFMMVGFNEELIYRGYIMQNLAEDWGMVVAVFVTSALFGLAHLLNPYASLISTLSITLSGIFAAYGYLVTRSLWLPIALHFSADFFGGVVFGLPISGCLEDFRLILVSVNGPEFITGGPFGPEAGLVGLGTLLLGIILLWAWGRARQRYLGQSQTTGKPA
jgi:membrane protease YdiL (CAAX protease family)